MHGADELFAHVGLQQSFRGVKRDVEDGKD